jgi:hypothetical protein
LTKLEGKILSDLDTINITPESFGKSRKNIENILIPKKPDLKKKLAEMKKEDKEGDWQIWEGDE